MEKEVAGDVCRDWNRDGCGDRNGNGCDNQRLEFGGEIT